MLENFTLDTFAQEMNSVFQIKRESFETVDLQLVEATDLGSTLRQEQFSIVFRGPNETPLMQAIYKIEHEKMGAFDLFIVPVGRDQKGMYYEAIFNRPR